MMRRFWAILIMLCCGWVSAQSYRIGDLYTAPDGSQGIVYYLYPDGSGGWVVALNDASEGCKWGEATDVPTLTNQNPSYFQQLLSDTAGYANTQIIRAYQNNSTYAAGVVDFAHGWVLPSPAQLSMLYGQQPDITPAIISAGGTALADDKYWTCAEQNATKAWMVNFRHDPTSGYFYATSKTNTTCRVRAVRSLEITTILYDTTLTYLWSTGSTLPHIEVTPEQTTTYMVTATTAYGCSNTLQQTIFVGGNAPQTLYDTICQGEGYEANGFSITPEETGTAGTLTRSREMVTGNCPSTITLYLTVSPSVTEIVEATACDSYEWNNVTYFESGIYTQTFTNCSGCDSVVTLHLTVIPMPELSHTPDTVIIAGASVDLWASGADVLYWADGDGNILASGPSLTVTPETCTTYYITGQNQSAAIGNNVVVNGDFELGNVAFTSAYTHVYTCSILNEGYYTVGVNAHDYHSGFYSGPDHTTGTGNYMIINGSMTLNTNVWTQTVTVEPNTDYAFSTWVCSLGGTPYYPTQLARLQFSVNGYQLGDIFTAPNAYGVWSNYYEVWNSGDNTSAVITILNQNTAAGGNDFGLDDIAFAPLTDCSATDSVHVNIIYQTNDERAVCNNELPYEWNGVTFTEATSQTATIPATNGCDSMVTMTLTVNPTYFIEEVEETCENTPYVWEGHNVTIPTEAGTHTVWDSLTTRHTLCDSIYKLTLLIHPTDSTALTETACESYTWNGITYTESGDYTQNFTNFYGCDSTVTLHLTVNHGTHDLIDTTVCESFTWEDGNGEIYTESGIYTYDYTNGEGCPSVDTLQLSVMDTIAVTITATADTICLGESVTLQAEADAPAETTFHVPPIAVGDILCTDNSIEKPSAWPVAGKTAMGIVFYVDNTGEHGWAMHLDDQADGINLMWSSSYNDVPELTNYSTARDAIFDMNGYANTQYVRAQGGASMYPAFWLVDFEHGWYLPSTGQLNILFSDVYPLNNSLQAVGGTLISMTISFIYWASTEESNTAVWVVKNNGTITSVDKTGNYYSKIRSVRDF